MKRLVDYINEELSAEDKSLVNYLINLLNSYKNGNNNSIDIKDIKRAYNMLLNLDSLDLNLNDNLYECLKDNLEKLHLKEDFINLFAKYKNKAKINDVLSKDDSNTNNNSNLITVVMDAFKSNKGVTDDDCIKFEKILKEVLSFKTSDKSNKGVGKGELFLNLFIDGAVKDKKSKPEKHGDVIIDDVGIEVKSGESWVGTRTYRDQNGGRIVANKNYIKDPKVIQLRLKETFSDYIDDVSFLDKIKVKGQPGGYNTSSANNIKEICKLLVNKMTDNKNNLPDDKFPKNSEEEYLYKYIFKEFSSIFYYQIFDSDDIPGVFKQFINEQANSINENNIGKRLINIHGVLSLIRYKEVENWDCIIVINVSSEEGGKRLGDYNYIYRDLLINNIDELYQYITKNFYFRNGPSYSSGANNTQDLVPTIYINIEK